MTAKKGNEPHRLGGPILVEEGELGKGVKWKFPKGINRFWERWKGKDYGGVDAMMGLQIGGQIPMKGPDILKFIKEHDPQNTSGAVKDALDIMQKLQDGSTKAKDLFSSIQPLKNILGGDLYGKMQAAGAAAKASEKVEEAAPKEDIIAELIAAAMAMLTPEDAVLATEALDTNEVLLIRTAYYGNGIYVSGKTEMPVAFVTAINYLIPIFRATKGAVS